MKDFKYNKGWPYGLDGWWFAANGDCGDYALYALEKLAGGRFKAIWALLTWRATIWLVWSPVNGVIPRHVALTYNGFWTDSTYREMRKFPQPNKRCIPLTFGPFTLVLPWLFLRMAMGAFYRIIRALT